MVEPSVGPGVRLSGHLLSEEIGQGGFSRVFRASPEGGGQEVAIKIAIRPELVSALRSEGAALKRLEGPRFVKVLEEHLEDDPPHFVLELCKGGDLRSLLERSPGKRLPFAEVRRLATGILEGVALMHDVGLVHGDLKPENILLDENGEPKIADLGLSRASRSGLLAKERELQATLLSAGAKVAGTLDYLAPELRRGGESSPASDVFALGVLLYEMLVGERPLGFFKLPGELVPGVPGEIDEAIALSLAANPAERVATARTLFRFVARPPVAFAPALPKQPSARPAPPMIRRERVPAAVLVAVLIAVVPAIMEAIKGNMAARREAPLAAAATPRIVLRASPEAQPVQVAGLTCAVSGASVHDRFGAAYAPASLSSLLVVVHLRVMDLPPTQTPGMIGDSFMRLRDATGRIYHVDARAQAHVEAIEPGARGLGLPRRVRAGEVVDFSVVFEVPATAISFLTLVLGFEGPGEVAIALAPSR